MIFTLGESGGPCNGDSGGPLVCRKDKESNWELFGITSWGLGCMHAPNAFARISSHYHWIWEMIAKYDDDAELRKLTRVYSGSIKNLGVNKIERETKIGLDKFRGDLERILGGLN